jgi:IS30 family transposase
MHDGHQLTRQDRIAIKQMYNSKEHRVCDIALLFNVDSSTIYRVCHQGTTNENNKRETQVLPSIDNGRQPRSFLSNYLPQEAYQINKGDTGCTAM